MLNGAGQAAIFGIEKRAIAPNPPGAGLHACATPASQATERKMNASSIVKRCSSTSRRAASSATSTSASSYSGAVAWGSQRSASSVTGHVACFPLRTSKRRSTSPAISTPVKQISPSPIAACMSPTANMPPGCRTGKKIRAPAPCQWSSRLPPWRPASPFESSSPPVATPTTPTIGSAGNETRSFIFTTPSCTSNSRVSGDRTWSMSWPKPGIRVATPHSIGRTSRISAMSESPGSAPFTATGPVALLIRERSISVTRSSSLRIWPVKQSFVSNVTVSPGSTSRAGRRSGPKAQTTSSRDRKLCCGIRWRDRFVLDVHAIEVGKTARAELHDQDRHDDSEDRVDTRHPVRILERVGRRHLDELVPEREEEQHDPADRQHEVQQGVELAPPRAQVVRNAAEAHEHVDDDDERHRDRRDDAEADAGVPLPADEHRDHERDAAEPDDCDVRRPEPRMRLAERGRSKAVARERVEHARRGVHRRVRVRRDRVADREEDDDPARAPEDLAEIPPRIGSGRLRDEVVEAGTEDPRI